MKFSIKDFFRKLRIRSHLLKKSLVEKLLFCAVKRTNKSLTFQIEKGIFHTTFRQHVVTSIVFLMFKSSRAELFWGKGVLRICSKLVGEHLSRSVISIKFQSNFIETTLRHGCSPFPKNTSGWLLLNVAVKWLSSMIWLIKCCKIQQNNYLYFQRTIYIFNEIIIYIFNELILFIFNAIIIYILNQIIILIQQIIYIFNQIIIYIFNQIIILIQQIIYIFNQIIIFIQWISYIFNEIIIFIQLNSIKYMVNKV